MSFNTQNTQIDVKLEKQQLERKKRIIDTDAEDWSSKRVKKSCTQEA